MKILVTGLCTLHWGRLEYGNVGNYYIVEPLFRELHRVFPDAEIMTTFQMTEDFKRKEAITCLPMEWYYSWTEDDLQNAKNEYEIAKKYTNAIPSECLTDWLKCIRDMDLVLDVSGDMWGDNAEHVGHDRFLVDLYKMRAAQLMGKKTVLFAVTPGPFHDNSTKTFAQEVFSGFSLVENREPTSTQNMEDWGFDISKVMDFACPAFLYTPSLPAEELALLKSDNPILYTERNKPICGFTIGGFNLPVGPYDMWPRDNEQYTVFVQAIEHIINTQNMKVVLFSHTNGFELPPNFRLINGRDYCILEQLRDIVRQRGLITDPDSLSIIEKPYPPAQLKTLIKHFDMLVTGRVHASVAGISQYVPTVFINYEKSFIPSTKMFGFADLAGVREYVCDPADKDELIRKIDLCAENRISIEERLRVNIPIVQQKAQAGFDQLIKL